MSALLNINNLSKSYANQVVLDEVSFSLSQNQRIGVIGRNGAGKSTLFKIITDQETADSGEVSVSDETILSYLKQEENFLDQETVLDYLIRSSQREDWRCAKIASQFGLYEAELNTPVLNLSGGYQMRVKLTAMLLEEPNLLMLDEPTNYLDMSTMLLLEDFLKQYKGAFMIISHDREFLENVCQETLEIELGKLNYFPGKLTQYEEHKQTQLESDLKFNQKQDRKVKHMQKFVDRFRYKASKASQAQAKLKAISKTKRISILEKPSDVWISIPEVEEPHGLACRLDDLSLGYDGVSIVENINFDIEKGQHLAVLGDNGEGKSTFLKTLAGKIPEISGILRWMPNTKLAYYAQHVSLEMPSEESVEGYLNLKADKNQSKQDILRMASNFLFKDDDLSKSISVLSGGEKARLCLAGILLNQNNVLLLDEPNNHLDFTTVEALARALYRTKATVLFISHDRTFVNLLADEIIEVRDGQIKKFMGDYDDYIESLRQRAGSQNYSSLKSLTKKDKDKQRENYLKLKENKKRLARLDKLIEEKNQEKEVLEEKISQDPTSYDQELYENFEKIKKEIKSAEDQWLILTKEISELES